MRNSVLNEWTICQVLKIFDLIDMFGMRCNILGKWYFNVCYALHHSGIMSLDEECLKVHSVHLKLPGLH